MEEFFRLLQDLQKLNAVPQEPYVPQPEKYSTPVEFLRGLAYGVEGIPSNVAGAVGTVADWALMPAAEFAQRGAEQPQPGPTGPTFRPGLPPPQVAQGGFTLDLGTDAPLPQRGIPGAPDYSEAERWLGQTAPGATDPEQLRKMVMMDWLAGLSGGLAGVNAGEEGIAAVLAGAAGGGAQGLASGSAARLGLEREERGEARDYARSRAGFAADKAETTAQFAASAADIRYSNEMAQYEAGQTKVISATKDGLTVQRGNTVQFVPTSSATQSWDTLKTAVDALGGDSAAVQPMIYEMMFENQAGLEEVQVQIVKDVIQQGAGSAVFGQELYQEALQVAEDQVPPELIGQEEAITYINNLVANLLLERTLELGDFTWLQSAAAMGNYGARKLVENRQLSAGEQIAPAFESQDYFGPSPTFTPPSEFQRRFGSAFE